MPTDGKIDFVFEGVVVNEYYYKIQILFCFIVVLFYSDRVILYWSFILFTFLM